MRCKAVLEFEMYERKCIIFHVRLLENSEILASKTAAYQCSYIHSRDSVCRLWLIVSAARSLTCRDDLDSKWQLLLAENELSRVSLLSRISIEN